MASNILQTNAQRQIFASYNRLYELCRSGKNFSVLDFPNVPITTTYYQQLEEISAACAASPVAKVRLAKMALALLTQDNLQLTADVNGRVRRFGRPASDDTLKTAMPHLQAWLKALEVIENSADHHAALGRVANIYPQPFTQPKGKEVRKITEIMNVYENWYLVRGEDRGARHHTQDAPNGMAQRALYEKFQEKIPELEEYIAEQELCASAGPDTFEDTIYPA